MSERELLPCPFCGGASSTAKDVFNGHPDSPWAVGCDAEDPCAGMAWFSTEANAIAAWNRRAPVSPKVEA